jgi:hypothetical protein
LIGYRPTSRKLEDAAVLFKKPQLMVDFDFSQWMNLVVLQGKIVVKG